VELVIEAFHDGMAVRVVKTPPRELRQTRSWNSNCSFHYKIMMLA
jgi:hypothetical protein